MYAIFVRLFCLGLWDSACCNVCVLPSRGGGDLLSEMLPDFGVD